MNWGHHRCFPRDYLVPVSTMFQETAQRSNLLLKWIPNSPVVWTWVDSSFPQSYMVPGSDTQQENLGGWRDSSPSGCRLLFLLSKDSTCSSYWLFYFMFPAHIHTALSFPQTCRSGMLEGLATPATPSWFPLPPCKTVECLFSQLLLLFITSLPSSVVLFPISIALWHILFLEFLSTPLTSLKVSVFNFLPNKATKTNHCRMIDLDIHV